MYGVDDALLIGGLAASAAGTGMGIAGNEAAQSAMNSARRSEVQDEQNLEHQANSVFQNSVGQSGAGTAQQEAQSGAAQRENAFNALKQVAQPIAGSQLPNNSASDSNPVVDTESSTGQGAGQTPIERANSLATARGGAWTNLTSNAAATEGGLRDWQNAQAIKNAEANRQIAPIASEAQSRAALLPLELQVAGASGDELSGWGSAIGALGNAASMAGAVNAFGSPALTAGTPSLAGGTVSDLGPAVGGETEPTDAWSTLMQYAPAQTTAWGAPLYAPQSYRRQQTIY